MKVKQEVHLRGERFELIIFAVVFIPNKIIIVMEPMVEKMQNIFFFKSILSFSSDGLFFL